MEGVFKMNIISAEYDQHYMDNFNAMLEQEKQREQARRRKKEDLYSFFELHYAPEGDYTSKIYIGCDIPNKKGKIYTFHHYQTGIEESLDALPVDFFTANNAKDYYVTANGLKKRGKRNEKNLFTLHNIVIDIDCHEYGISKKDRDNEIEKCEIYLQELFDNSLDLPAPNTIVKTGRGLQLWWAIKPLSAAKLKNIYKETAVYLCDQLDEKISKQYYLNFLRVDRAASLKMAGYFRLPGTYNSKAKKWGDFAFLHEDRLDVVDFYFDKIASCKKNPIPFIGSKKYALADYREHILYALLELRRKEGWVEDGYRDTFCFILFNTILEEYGEEKADEAVRKMNRSFSHPLSEKSLKSYLSTSRKKGYKFSNQTIINYLCITKEEQDMLHFHPSSKREEEREKKRQIKRERVQLVIELAKEGRSQRQIAKMAGTSQSTVCRILRDPDKALAPRKTTENKTEENQIGKKESDSKQSKRDESEKLVEKVNGEKEDKTNQKNLPCRKQVENDNTNRYKDSLMINERKAMESSVMAEQDTGG